MVGSNILESYLHQFYPAPMKHLALVLAFGTAPRSIGETQSP